MSEKILTGKPSVDKPWLKYYPQVLLDNLQVPPCTIEQYLQFNMPGLDVSAMHYYGTEVTWQEVFVKAELAAKALKALGFGPNDQIPVFLRSVPEFIYLLLAAEKLGASLLIRDNTIEENVDAVNKSGAKVLITHDFLSKSDMQAYLDGSKVEKFVLIDPCTSCDRSQMPDYVEAALDANYPEECASGDAVMNWDAFLSLGAGDAEPLVSAANIHSPLIRCYTSGSTGPSKQVIHSARTIIGVLTQMNFYAASDVRPTWLVTILPPTLVAVVISMLLLPLASNKLLIMAPWLNPNDVDLELMRYRPNAWPIIPMFMEVVIRNNRIPDDYDMSHLHAAGCGCEAYNNSQMARAQKFLYDHNCNITFTTGYGSSEAGSNVAFHISDAPMGNGNAGCPMPLSNISIFKPGTTQEMTYGDEGEICISGPGVMMGYDDPEATKRVLKVHEDGQLWLHMGDIGRMDENGVLYTIGRGSNKRFGGGFLDILPMENRIADAAIPGILDEFFVNIPDDAHEGYYVPYLYVVLDKGYTVADVTEAIHAVLADHMIPVEIIQLPERPFWHFKTNRIGLMQEVLAKRGCTGK